MEYIEEFKKIILPMLDDKRVWQMDEYIQHGTTTCLQHTIAVAYKSFYIAKKYNIKCDLESLVRGALLHDYFLYDWHDPDPSHRLHGFHHAKRAMENADRDFGLNKIEKDIILKHMFPLNIAPPRYVESYIVTTADKLCSARETVYGVGKNIDIFSGESEGV